MLDIETGVKLRDLEGLIPNYVGTALTELASWVPKDQAIVEIGSYKGKSTCHLAAGAQLTHGAHVTAVDAWDLLGNISGKHGYADPATKRAFHSQIARLGFGHHITAINAHSIDAARDWNGPPIGLLYIDGDHTQTGVEQDIEAWTPHLAPTATVAFDDYGTARNPGVKTAVDAWADKIGANIEILAERLATIELATEDTDA